MNIQSCTCSFNIKYLFIFFKCILLKEVSNVVVICCVLYHQLASFLLFWHCHPTHKAVISYHFSNWAILQQQNTISTISDMFESHKLEHKFMTVYCETSFSFKQYLIMIYEIWFSCCSTSQVFKQLQAYLWKNQQLCCVLLQLQVNTHIREKSSLKLKPPEKL